VNTMAEEPFDRVFVSSTAVEPQKLIFYIRESLARVFIVRTNVDEDSASSKEIRHESCDF
jgi:hypothetical protein